MSVCSFRDARLGLDLAQQSPFEAESRKKALSLLPPRPELAWLHGGEGIYKLFSHFHTVSSIPNGGTNSTFVRDPWLLGLSGFHGNHKAHWKGVRGRRSRAGWEAPFADKGEGQSLGEGEQGCH